MANTSALPVTLLLRVTLLISAYTAYSSGLVAFRPFPDDASIVLALFR